MTLTELFEPDIGNAIEKYCKPYLNLVQDYTKYPIYRGLNPNRIYRDPAIGLDVVQGYIPNRKPKDTSAMLHSAFNNAFNELFGVPFRDALMCTGDKLTAATYADRHDTGPYQIFPIGEFKFCWSPDVSDVYVEYETEIGKHHLDTHDYFNRLGDHVMEDIKKHYKTTDLKSAIKSGNEIMIYCEKCIVVKL